MHALSKRTSSLKYVAKPLIMVKLLRQRSLSHFVYAVTLCVCCLRQSASLHVDQAKNRAIMPAVALLNPASCRLAASTAEAPLALNHKTMHD